MKFIVLTTHVAAAVLLGAVAPVAAQQGQGGGGGGTAAASKVAYVNTREILRQTPGYAQAESLYNKEAESYQAELRKLQTSLDSAANDLERQSTLNPSQRATRQKSFQDQREKAEQRFRELQEKMVTRERELLEPIQTRINSVIEGVRAAGGYAIIFDVSAPNSGIVTADRSLDLTQKVIQQLK